MNCTTYMKEQLAGYLNISVENIPHSLIYSTKGFLYIDTQVNAQEDTYTARFNVQTMQIDKKSIRRYYIPVKMILSPDKNLNQII